MILDANTVVYPITMVIEALYTFATSVTVSRTMSHENLAVRANLSEVNILNDDL